MKALRYILIGIVFLIGAVYVLGFMSRSTWKVERSIVVQADPARVAAWALDLKNWPPILPQTEGNERLDYTFGAESSGVGAVMSWQSTHGQGSLRITRVDSTPAGGEVAYTTTFPLAGNAGEGALVWKPEGSGSAGTGTRITLRDSGDVGWNPMLRLMLSGVIEKALGVQREQSLELLRGILDAPDRADGHANAHESGGVSAPKRSPTPPADGAKK